jgi:hypothetical protein
MLSQLTYNVIEMNIRCVSDRVMNGLDSRIIKRYWCGQINPRVGVLIHQYD